MQSKKMLISGLGAIGATYTTKMAKWEISKTE